MTQPCTDQAAGDLLDDIGLAVTEIGNGSTGYDDEAPSCEEPVAT